jgi:hypothetical protein
VADVTASEERSGQDKPERTRSAADIGFGGMGVAEMLGGPRGVVESAIPGVAFAVVYSLNGQELTSALWVALATGGVIMLLSLAQRRPVRQAVGGFLGVAVMAGVARFTGRAEDFYIASVLKNGAWCLVYLVSILARWPLLGVFLGPVLGEGFAWRKDPRRLRAYAVASWFWVAMFGIRFAIQLPLYLAGSVTALGLINVPLGLPLFGFTCWLSFLVLKRVPPARTEDELDEVEDVEEQAQVEAHGHDDEGGDSAVSAGRAG